MHERGEIMKKEKGKKNNVFLYVAIISMMAFGGAFAFYAYDYYLYWQDGRIAQENTDVVRGMFQGQMDDISQIMAAMPRIDAAAGGSAAADAAEPEVQPLSIAFDTSPLDYAREMVGNPDIVAYLFIEGTNVNNVILQAANNSFYLNHDMFGNRNVNGAVFMDFRNTPDFTDPNTIVYGHNMRNGTMFHNVRYFMQREFFEAHPHIKVITQDTVFIYEIFSAFSTHIDFDYIQVFFDTPDEFGELIGEIKRRSVHDTDITANQDDRILILSTCTNVNQNMRYVVTGRLLMELKIEN